MRVKILRPFMLDGGRVTEVGEELKVGLQRARDLERMKLAVPVLNKVVVDKIVASGVADKSTPRPTSPPPIGSPIGEASPALSSPPDPPRTKRKYIRRKAKPESSP